MGGYFGMGWLRDLCRIPEYVDDANSDPQYMEELKVKMRRDKPPSTPVRSVNSDNLLHHSIQ